MDHPRPLVACTSCGRDRPHHAHGWCSSCYDRWDHHGRPADGPPAPNSLPRRAPVHFIDDTAVERAAAGWLDIRLNPAERRAAVARLAGRGLSTRQIADRLGCATRTIERHLAVLNRTTTPAGARL